MTFHPLLSNLHATPLFTKIEYIYYFVFTTTQDKFCFRKERRSLVPTVPTLHVYSTISFQVLTGHRSFLYRLFPSFSLFSNRFYHSERSLHTAVHIRHTSIIPSYSFMTCAMAKHDCVVSLCQQSLFQISKQLLSRQFGVETRQIWCVLRTVCFLYTYVWIVLPFILLQVN